jgi:hypothetical protein
MAFEAGGNDLPHVQDLGVNRFGISGKVRAPPEQGRLDVIDLEEIMLPEDLHLVERDQLIQLGFGGFDREYDINAADQENDRINDQPDDDLSFHRLLT